MVNYSKIVLIIFISLLINGCFLYSKKLDEHNFYEYSMLESDVWRLPIIYPYQLTSAYCCENWTFGKYNEYDKIFTFTVSPDSINYNNYHITLCSIYSDTTWYVLNIKTKQTHEFNNFDSFCQFRRINNISDTMYYCEEVFLNWKENNILPWK